MKHLKEYKLLIESLLEEEIFNSVEIGKIELVKRYVYGGGDVNLIDDDGWSLLMFASSYEVVEVLVEQGADVNYRNTKTDASVLYIAVYNFEDLESIELLLKNDATSNNDENLLIEAVSSGNPELIYLLINDANWNNVNDDNETFLDILEYNHSELHDEIIEKYPEKYEKYLKIKKSKEFNL